MTRDASPDPRALAAAALGCAAAAGLLTWAAATRSPALHVPPAIAYVVAAVLALAAGRLLQMRGASPGAGDGFATLILAGMTAICAWIALGPGDRACRAGQSLRAMAPHAGLECRVPFGVGGALVAATTLYAATRWLRARRAAAREVAAG